MNPLAIIATKLVLKKVAKEFANQVHANPNVKTVKLGEDVYLKEADKKKGAIWAVLITLFTVAGSMGWVPPEVAEAFVNLFSNEQFIDGVEGAAEVLTH
jgi:hypothetical protein